MRGQRERRVPVAESKNILIIEENISKTTNYIFPLSWTYKLLSHISYELMNTFYFTPMLDGG